MSQSLTGVLSLFTAAFLYGSLNIPTRLAGINFGPFLSTSLRGFVVLLVLVWFVKWKKIKLNDWKWFLLRGFGNIISTTFLFIAVNKMPVGTALFSFYASLILSGGLFGIIFYKEKVTVVKFISLFLTASGLYLVYNSQSSLTFNWYFIIAMIGGIGGSLWCVFSRPITKSYSLKQLVVVDATIIALFSLMTSFALHEPWQMVKFDYKLLAVFYLGLSQVFTGQLVPYGFKTIDAQVGSVILLNDTIFGTILAYLFFKEVVSVYVIIGGALIFLSSIIPIITNHNIFSIKK